MRVQIPAPPVRRGLTVTLVFVAIAIVGTWPTARHLGEAIPLGAEAELTVPVFSLWGIWWVGAHAPVGLWQAPIFHPASGALAFSEPQLLAGLLAAPLWALGLPPAAVHNLVVLAFLAANGLFACRLVVALGAGRAAALGAGAIAVTLPAVTSHLGSPPILPLFGIAWSLEGLVRFARSGAARDAAWAAAGFAALALGSMQIALLWAPAAVPALLVAVRARHDGMALRRLVLAGVAAALLVAAVAWPAARNRARYEMTRDDAVVTALSVKPIDFMTRPPGATLGVPPRAWPELGDAGGQFPGFGLLTLALLSLMGAVRAPPAKSVPGVDRAWVVALALGAGVAALLSMGTRLELLGWQPFATLRAIVPGLDGLRAPYRWVVVMQTLLVPLAGVGLGEIRRALRRHTVPAVVALGLVAAAENAAVPVSLQRIPASPQTPWAEWLRSRPGDEVVLHLPLPSGFHVSDYAIEARRMFAQLHHGRRLVNGYSSFFPPDYTRLQVSLRGDLPDPGNLCVVRRIFEVDLMVVDRPWLRAREEAASAAGPEARNPFDDPAAVPMLTLAYEDDEVVIWKLAPPPGVCEVAVGQ